MTYYKVLENRNITVSKPGFFPTTFYRYGKKKTIYCDTYIVGKNYPRTDLNAARFNKHIEKMIEDLFDVKIW